MDTQKNLTLDQVVEESFDFSDYSETEKQKLIVETSGMIMEAAVLRSLDEGGEKLQEKFGTFIESKPSEDAMAVFITENFLNFSEIIAEELKTFKEGEEEK